MMRTCGLSVRDCEWLLACRVYYSSQEKPEEVWAELADGSCRWRQTGSEIKVICLKVVCARPSLSPSLMKAGLGNLVTASKSALQLAQHALTPPAPASVGCEMRHSTAWQIPSCGFQHRGP